MIYNFSTENGDKLEHAQIHRKMIVQHKLINHNRFSYVLIYFIETVQSLSDH